MVIIIILALVYIVNLTGVQIPTQMPQPQFSTNKFPLFQTTTNTKKPITITFPDITFQISSNFYTYNGTILKQQYLHNISSYTQQQLNCTLYKTSLNIHPISNIFYNQSIDIIKYTIDIRNNSMNILYILDSDSVLSVYNLNKTLINIKNTYNIDKNITGINDNGVLQGGNIELFVVSGVLFLVNKNSMYYFNETNSKKFIKLNGYVGKNEIIDVGIIQQNQQLTDSKIWIGTTRGITTYLLMNTDQLYASIGQYKNGIISDTITAITYCTQSQYFYITAGHTLYIVDLVNNMPILQYQLNSTCSLITKISQTLYISCQYHRINFIIQLHFQQNYQQLFLNKYYNDDTISGYKKIAIIGDQQAMIINQGTNRKLLLDLGKYNKQQNYQYIYSFNMYEFYYLQQYSTEQQVIILVIGSRQVALHKLVFQSPEIVCVFDQNSKVEYSILVVFNTTYCPITDNQNQQQIINTNFYCQSYYPILIQINKIEYQQKTAKFIFVIIFGVLGIIIGFIVFCGCMIRNKANKVIQGLREKIQKVRLLHQQSEAQMI